MHTLRVPTDPRGPTTVAALFAWSIQFWCALRDEGLASLGIDFAACLGSVLAGGLHVHTDYSGMGRPEEAMPQILAAASSVALAIPGGVVEAVRPPPPGQPQQPASRGG